jgi:hypothetical protein
MKKRKRIFTWHIHGTYLYYLSQGNFDIFIPTSNEKKEGYVGRGKTFPFGENVIEVPQENVKHLEFDCILYQTNQNYLVDQYEILSNEQRTLPRIYLEHDPPRLHPVNSKHIVDDPHMLLVHVTAFNQLMWDNNSTPNRVIEHGVVDNGCSYSGESEKGIVVINNLPTRGRICGFDIFNEVAREIPLDLIGMGTEKIGLGEVLHPKLPAFLSQYRFFFNPIRYTSMGLAVCEAMMLGLPVVGLATTEMSTVFENGKNGFIDTNITSLISSMKKLLENRSLATTIGQAGRETATQRFNIERFIKEWEVAFTIAADQAFELNLSRKSPSMELSD